MIEKISNRSAQSVWDRNDQVLKIAHRRQRVRKSVHLSRPAFLGQKHEFTELGARVLDPDILNEGATSRTREQRFGEGEVVLRLVEEDRFVQHGVGERVQAPRDKADGREVVLLWQRRQDLDQELVGEVEQVSPPQCDCHGGVFAGRGWGRRRDVESCGSGLIR